MTHEVSYQSNFEQIYMKCMLLKTCFQFWTLSTFQGYHFIEIYAQTKCFFT